MLTRKLSPEGFAKRTAIEEPHHNSPSSPAPPVLGEKNQNPLFQDAGLRKTASLHLFSCCRKPTLTGSDPKQGQLQNAEILQPGRTQRPPLATLPPAHSTSIMWEHAWAGGCCQNSPGPDGGGLVLWPKIFPKSPHRISRLLPTLHSPFGEIPGSDGPKQD